MPSLPASARRAALLTAALAALAALAACGKSPRVDHGGLAYPTFELFDSVPAFDILLRNSETVSLSQVSGIACLIDEQLRTTSHREDHPYVSASDESAELAPRIPPEELPAWRVAPLVFLRLARAWDEPQWSAVDATEAIQGAALLREIRGAPEVRFAVGDDAGNHRSLEQLVRWFHSLQGRPECLAAMVFTLDAGPFAGIALPGEPLSETKTVRALEDGLDLRIARLEGEPEPCALQCVRDGRVIWTSVLSGQPVGRVSSAELADVDAFHLGPWGYAVALRVKWTAGEKHALVYLDRTGKLLFYFLGR